MNRTMFKTSFEDAAGYLHLDGARRSQAHVRSGRYAVALSHENESFAITDIPVEEGAWYVISGYMYVDALPADVVRYYVEFMNHGREIDIPSYPMVAISKAGAWEEFVLPVYIKKDLHITDLKLLMRNVGAPDTAQPTGDVWIDDISMRRVPDSASLYGDTPPGPRHGFDGALVRVDDQGNFSIRKAGGFEPFLPIIVYPGGNPKDWGKYRDKGFNTVICNTLKEAEAAVGEGLYWIWSLYDYGIYDGDESGYARFEREYRYLREQHPEWLDKLLYFYWDNERYLLFDSVKHFSDTIGKLDRDAAGKRLRPFMMQLDFTMANPHYHNDTYRLVDLQSCYANPMIFEDNDPQNYQGVEFKGNYDGEFANFAIFDHLPGVTIPKTVFVVNSPFGDKHLANTIFAAFARGGKGFAYWKDGGSQPRIETKAWWPDFRRTAAKMQALLPLLRQPMQTDWDLHPSLADDEDGIVVGKRDFGSRRCMIAASRSNKAERVRFAGEGVADGSKIYDYFSGKAVAAWREGHFDLTFAPRGYGAYCW